jgi:hypothetical protein
MTFGMLDRVKAEVIILPSVMALSRWMPVGLAKNSTHTPVVECLQRDPDAIIAGNLVVHKVRSAAILSPV